MSIKKGFRNRNPIRLQNRFYFFSNYILFFISSNIIGSSDIIKVTYRTCKSTTLKSQFNISMHVFLYFIRQAIWKTFHKRIWWDRNNSRAVSRGPRCKRVQGHFQEKRWKERVPTRSKWSLHLFQLFPHPQKLSFGTYFLKSFWVLN